MFDFDGTVGMIRAGWMPVMLDMMTETLAPLGDPTALRAEAEAYVARFTGRDTIEQMKPFVEQVRRLGGEPLSAEDYKAEFLRRLSKLRLARIEALASGATEPDRLMIPGVRTLLEWLHSEGVPLYLASGSPHEEICDESKLLDIGKYFAGIHGSSSGGMTKRDLLASIISGGNSGRRHRYIRRRQRRDRSHQRELAAGQSGWLPMSPRGSGSIRKKRVWLIEAGADFIIPNYLDLTGLQELLADRVRH